MSYQPIENYGIIGNMRTVALVGMNGSIDWYCYPHFDSPSIFGAILDDKRNLEREFPFFDPFAKTIFPWAWQSSADIVSRPSPKEVEAKQASVNMQTGHAQRRIMEPQSGCGLIIAGYQL